MEINDALIDKIATLSKLKFDGEEKEEIKNDFSRMLNFVDKLKELNVDNVEPLVYMNEKILFWREDNIKDSVEKNDALKNAPLKDTDYFLVPKVLENKY
jgi:aspartyl-tRNA(Asn)/glutamyl-tRNA(Gln) amidotransferase subunit C